MFLWQVWQLGDWFLWSFGLCPLFDLLCSGCSQCLASDKLRVHRLLLCILLLWSHWISLLFFPDDNLHWVIFCPFHLLVKYCWHLFFCFSSCVLVFSVHFVTDSIPAVKTGKLLFFTFWYLTDWSVTLKYLTDCAVILKHCVQRLFADVLWFIVCDQVVDLHLSFNQHFVIAKRLGSYICVIKSYLWICFPYYIICFSVMNEWMNERKCI